MKKIMLLAATMGLMLAITGCASLAVYPSYKETVKVSVSSEAPSTWADIPAGATIISNSQVVVHGRGGNNVLPILFGGIGSAIQKGLNSSAVSDVKSNFVLKFDSGLLEAFQRESALEPYASKFKFSISKSEKAGDILLYPSAWFTITDDSQVRLDFRVIARFSDASGSKVARFYWSRGATRPFSGKEGWAEDNAALFKKAEQRAFEQIVQVILRDIAGECSNGCFHSEYTARPFGDGHAQNMLNISDEAKPKPAGK